VKIDTEITHRDFLTPFNAEITESDKVSIYAPSELIVKFGNADITNQQFIDGCIVIVDGNRVQVNLVGGR
jgi:hypothetical protein